MVEIPVVFLLTFYLLALLIWVIVRHRKAIRPLPILTLCVLVAQSFLLGLRWAYHVTQATSLQVLLAALIPPLVLLSMRRLVSTAAATEPVERIILLFVPSFLIVASHILHLPITDYEIFLTYVGFGASLLFFGIRRDLEWNDRVPFRDLMQTRVAFIVAGSGMILSAVVDIAVNYDIRHDSGHLAPDIVGFSDLVVLLVMASALIFTGRGIEGGDSLRAVPASGLDIGAAEGLSIEENVEKMQATLEKMEREIIARKLYRDPDLSLNSLSRKLVISSRQISTTVNNLRAMNVSQYINMFRISEAAQLIKAGNMPITAVIFEVGFNTKSNFNREFKRITGMNPSDWRRANGLPEDSEMRRFREELSPKLRDDLFGDAGVTELS